MTGLKRAIVVVLDGVGAGANPDAHAYGDDGASSLEHCAQAIGGQGFSARRAPGSYTACRTVSYVRDCTCYACRRRCRRTGHSTSIYRYTWKLYTYRAST